MIYPPRDFTHKILKISTKYQDPPRHAHKICVKFPYSFFLEIVRIIHMLKILTKDSNLRV